MSVTQNPKIGSNTKIASTAVIESDVEIGDNCVISEYVILRSGVKIGNDNYIHPFAVIGEEPQDLNYKNESSYVEIGDNNRIREFVTIHRGTGLGSKTSIGSNCLLMAYSHVGHNSQVGNHVILTNNAQLAGYVQVGDYAVIGGDASVHQHCRIGTCAMLGGKSATNQDIPPYVIATGIPARGITVNKHALRRSGMAKENIRQIRDAFNILYRKGNTLASSISHINELLERACTESQSTEVRLESADVGIALNATPLSVLLDFLKSTKRGVKLTGPTWGGNPGSDIDFGDLA